MVMYGELKNIRNIHKFHRTVGYLVNDELGGLDWDFAPVVITKEFRDKCQTGGLGYGRFKLITGNFYTDEERAKMSKIRLREIGDYPEGLFGSIKGYFKNYLNN